MNFENIELIRRLDIEERYAFLLQVIAIYEHPVKKICWATRDRLARDIKRSRRTVQRRLNVLESLRLITIVADRDGGRRPTSMHINTHRLQELIDSKVSLRDLECTAANTRTSEHSATLRSIVAESLGCPGRDDTPDANGCQYVTDEEKNIKESETCDPVTSHQLPDAELRLARWLGKMLMEHVGLARFRDIYSKCAIEMSAVSGTIVLLQVPDKEILSAIGNQELSAFRQAFGYEIRPVRNIASGPTLRDLLKTPPPDKMGPSGDLT